MRYFEIIAVYEARRNPAQNPKTDPVKELLKYKGRTDVFVSYTHDVGVMSSKEYSSYNDGENAGGVRAKNNLHNIRGHKIGINPQSGYGTPLGVYCYPVDYVIEKDHAVEFGGERPYMVVIQARDMDKMLDIATYSFNDYMKDMRKVDDIFQVDTTMSNVLEYVADQAKIDIPAAKLWNVTRALTDPTAMHDYQLEYEDQNSEDDEDEDDEPSNYYDDEEEYDSDDDDYFDNDDEDEEEQPKNDWDVNPDDWDEEAWGPQPEKPYFSKDPDQMSFNFNEAAEPGKKPSVQWARLLRQLGYEGAIDSKGSGLIHTNEPFQAVFFSKPAFVELELIHNVDRQQARTKYELWDQKPEILNKGVKTGKITPQMLVDFWNAAAWSRPLLDHLPESHWKYFLDNIPYDNLESLISRAEMNKAQAVFLLNKYGERAIIPLSHSRFVEIKTALADYVMPRLKNFSQDVLSILNNNTNFLPEEFYVEETIKEIRAYPSQAIGIFHNFAKRVYSSLNLRPTDVYKVWAELSYEEQYKVINNVAGLPGGWRTALQGHMKPPPNQ